MHRIRLLLLAAAIVLVSLFGFARPSGAEEEKANYKDHTTEECAHLLAEGKEIDECQKAPNPLIPATNELLWGFIGFALVFGFHAGIHTYINQ